MGLGESNASDRLKNYHVVSEHMHTTNFILYKTIKTVIFLEISADSMKFWIP
jgi:hypothetical protein